jgi:ferrous iron transport protein B
MGLTNESVGLSASRECDLSSLEPLKRSPDDYIVALAGNPNVGKSTLFNALTGMNQHTGNWTGKTVCSAAGYSKKYNLVAIDLPGAYSLRAHSPEEEVARDFIINECADVVVVICDALCIERNLILALQIIEHTQKVVICVNLLDEAERKGISVNLSELSKLMGVRVVGTSANRGEGIDSLCLAVRETAAESTVAKKPPLYYPDEIEAELDRLSGIGYTRAACIRYFFNPDEAKPDPELEASLEKLCENKPRDYLAETIIKRPVIIAEDIANQVVTSTSRGYSSLDRKIDKIVTNKFLAWPIMLVMLAGIFWLTIVGSNYPSAALESLFDTIETFLYDLTYRLGAPLWLIDVTVGGVLHTLFKVVSVMLPPMAIFFPLFTLLEDFGLLGRIAFNLDGAFKACSACGKQALTMSMGLGCNAAGVIGCRIINSPRERTIAILTNNFMPCNGRFPILIAITALLTGSAASLAASGVAGAAIMTVVLIVGGAATLGVSKLLSVTILKGLPSSFTLELPPYRKPQIRNVIIRSIFDRTLFVLGRAVVVAAPAGLVIWVLANIKVADISLLNYMWGALDGLGRLAGVDGIVLCAFILGFPANEIVLPLMLMMYTQGTSLGGDSGLAEILAANGWNTLTYINMLILTVFHFPCSTTLLTIKKETGSVKYTILSAVIPTLLGLLICIITTALSKI